ncbi:hypothetical protein ACKRZS_004226 [Fusarium odoratissimum]
MGNSQSCSSYNVTHNISHKAPVSTVFKLAPPSHCKHPYEHDRRPVHFSLRPPTRGRFWSRAMRVMSGIEPKIAQNSPVAA